MSVHRALRLAPALVASVTLSGCWLFPFPFGTGAAQQLVVENATDTDWVLSVTGEFATPYAIPAGETGQVELYGGPPTVVTLLDVECTEVDHIDWDGSSGGVRIAEPGTLSPIDATQQADLTSFSEYFECGFGAPPEAGDPLPGGSGSISIYGGDGTLWSLDVATAELTLVAESDELDVEHAWSPDGSQVAFTRYLDDDIATSLVIRAADGSGERVLVENAATPMWSPDGGRIAYLDLDPFAGGSALAAIDLETGDTVALADDVASARWSPDGATIAFIAGDFTSPMFDPNEPGASELRIVNADGTDLQTLAPAAPFSAAPAWSPDGTLIAFTGGLDPGGGPVTEPNGIHLYDVARDEVRTAAQIEGAMLGEPAWSPDGARLAFTVTTPGLLAFSGAIGVVPIGGGAPEQIGLLDDGVYWTPIWSPDGEWVAATRSVGTELASNLAAIALDGGEEIVLATGVSSNGPVWRSAP